MNGYEVLKKISEVLDRQKDNKHLLFELSHEFFSFVPHDHGLSPSSNFTIN